MTFDRWWEGYSKSEHFNEPLDTLRHSDHDQQDFDDLIKKLARAVWEKSWIESSRVFYAHGYNQGIEDQLEQNKRDATNEKAT
jgi:hypothetical protein